MSYNWKIGRIVEVETLIWEKIVGNLWFSDSIVVMESYFHNIAAYFAEIEAEGNDSFVIGDFNHDLMLFCRLVSYFAWSTSSATQFDYLFFYFTQLLFLLIILLNGFKSFSTDLLSLKGKNFLNLVQILKANFDSQLIGSPPTFINLVLMMSGYV